MLTGAHEWGGGILMSDELNSEITSKEPAESQKTKTLEAAGWGLLLVWLGITTLLSLGWPIFLIGLGAMVLALQWVRSSWNLGTETFWLILGAVFIVAGIAELLGAGFSLVPVALILFGLAALYDVYKRLKEHQS